MRKFLSLLLLSVLGTSRTLPVDPPMEEDPELTGGFFEGDIVLEASERNGLAKVSRHWPDGIVYYKFSEGVFDTGQVLFIKGAMKTIEDVSCVRFIEADDDQPYFINITGFSDGCYSTVGFTGKVQKFNVKRHDFNKGCFRAGTIIHEFLHTLGFYHMQNTYNRDDYVRIVTENIVPIHLKDFKKYDEKFIDDFETAYDYGSILQYSTHAFSANGKMTIVPLMEVPKGLMGQRLSLSEGDICKLNRMYNCSSNKLISMCKLCG